MPSTFETYDGFTCHGIIVVRLASYTRPGRVLSLTRSFSFMRQGALVRASVAQISISTNRDHDDYAMRSSWPVLVRLREA